MMKRQTYFVLLVVLIVSVYLSSCKRCTQCTVYDKDNGEVIQISPEFCGNKEDVMKYRDAYKILYGSAADVVCD